jgi:hypothetical protein
MDGAEMHQALHTAAPAGFDDIPGALDIDFGAARPVIHQQRDMRGQVIYHAGAAKSLYQ